MELRHLRYFVTVAEELHFSRAAQRLGISQPPLSQQIHALEEELGTRLFRRTNRRVELTAAGQLFLGEAREALARVERAIQVGVRAGRGELGQLRIGVTSSVPLLTTIPRAIMAFRRIYPEVELVMRELTSREQLAPLEAGDLDVGVMRPTPLPATLQAVGILHEPLVAVVHEDSPYARCQSLPFAEIAHEPFIFFSASVGTGLHATFHELFQVRGLSAHIVQEAGGAMTIIGLVASGLGISILPASFRHVSIEHVRYIELADSDAVSEVWLTHARNRLTPQAEAFIALLDTQRIAPDKCPQP